MIGKNDKPDSKQASADAKQAKAKRPTPAQQGKQPTLAVRNQPAESQNQFQDLRQKYNSKMQLPSQAGKAQSKQAAYGRPPLTNRTAEADRPNIEDNAASLPAIPTVSNANAIRGFGMKVEALKENLVVVTQVDPRGNAAEAGLKRGDQIVEFAGIKLAGIEEYNSVADVLGQGDELELKISRRGSTKEITLMFGKRKEEPQPGDYLETESKGSPVSSSTSAAKRGGVIGSGLNRSRATGDYEFVPPQDQRTSQANQSVLERSTQSRGFQFGKN